MVGRPQARPNYGFIKQLDMFEKCGYAPSSSHPQYRSWKRRHVQDINNYLNHIVDTVTIVPDKLLMTRFVKTPVYYIAYLSNFVVATPSSPALPPRVLLVNFRTTPSKPSLFF